MVAGATRHARAISLAVKRVEPGMTSSAPFVVFVVSTSVTLPVRTGLVITVVVRTELVVVEHRRQASGTADDLPDPVAGRDAALAREALEGDALDGGEAQVEAAHRTPPRSALPFDAGCHLPSWP
jgi:hypothetical protein